MLVSIEAWFNRCLEKFIGKMEFVLVLKFGKSAPGKDIYNLYKDYIVESE